MLNLLLVTVALACRAVAADPAITPAKKTALFDGRSLDNFYGWLEHSKYDDPKKVYSVTGSAIRISGEEWGGLTTRKAYRDYHLIVEWKWGKLAWPPRDKRARDSGILVHGTGRDGFYQNRWLQSVEHQIIEGGSGDIILVAGDGKLSLTAETRRAANGQPHWQRGGTPLTLERGRFNWFGRAENWKDELGFRGPADLEKPVGEWNRSETICDGDRITTIVNGVVAVEGSRSSLTEGKIQIQSEGAEIFLRKVELRPLKKRRAS